MTHLPMTRDEIKTCLTSSYHKKTPPEEFVEEVYILLEKLSRMNVGIYVIDDVLQDIHSSFLSGLIPDQEEPP